MGDDIGAQSFEAGCLNVDVWDLLLRENKWIDVILGDGAMRCSETEKRNLVAFIIKSMFCPLLEMWMSVVLTSVLQSGKVHFSHIYGIGVMGCLAIYALLSLMAVSGVTLGTVVSVLGYCLLPMVVLSGINVVLSLQ